MLSRQIEIKEIEEKITYLEVETVEEFTDEKNRAEYCLQHVLVISTFIGLLQNSLIENTMYY